VQPGHAADHSPPSSAMVMEEYSYNSTHPLGHYGPVMESLHFSQCKEAGIEGFKETDSS